MNGRKRIVIVGGGPAGLMAAEVAARSGCDVQLFDAMPSVGRKFLMAGKGGMNITHAEPFADFCARYGQRRDRIVPLLETFGPDAVRAWMHGLGIESFVGSSGRVFPVGMKAAPLLRSWLHRLRESGVGFHVRHRWCGLERMVDGRYQLDFQSPGGERNEEADGVVLATGGGSWAKLGSDGRWIALLESLGVPVAPLCPANCGFDVRWSGYLRERFAGQPVKSVVASCIDRDGREIRRRGEFVVTEHGVEGSLIYALSAPLRDAIYCTGGASLTLDLLPDHDAQRVRDEVARPRGARSLSSHLQSRLGLKGLKMALLNELLSREAMNDPTALAAAICSS